MHRGVAVLLGRVAHGQRALDAKHVRGRALRPQLVEPVLDQAHVHVAFCLEAHARHDGVEPREARYFFVQKRHMHVRGITRVRALDDDLVEPREEVAALPRLELLQCSGEVAVAPAARHGAAVRRLHEVDAVDDALRAFAPLELRAVDAQTIGVADDGDALAVLARQDVLEQVALLGGGEEADDGDDGDLGVVVLGDHGGVWVLDCFFRCGRVRFTVDGSTSFRS